jgi:hypothetical protein
MNALRLRSPADVVAAVPYLIGFHPADSVVVLACDRTQGAFAVRLDLTAHDALLDHIAGLVARRKPEAVIVAGYGAAARVTPMVDRVRDRLAAQGVPLREALRVEDGRFWSYLCSDSTCCPPEGTYVDVSTSPVAAAALAGGMVALPDRREHRLAAWAEEDVEAVPVRMAREGVPLVRELIRRASTDAALPDEDEVAWLGVLLVSLRVRDEAWVRMNEPDLNAHMRLWRHVLTHVTPTYAAAPASLLSFAAWRVGEGALANIALDRALATDPHYTMARLLQELFISGLPPWSIPLDITPDELEETD